MPPTLADAVTEIVRLIDLAYAVGGSIFLIILLIIGVQYLLSRGDDEQTQSLRQRGTYWLIGFVLFFMSAAIVSFTYDIFDVRGCNGERVTPGFNLVFDEACGCGSDELRQYDANGILSCTSKFIIPGCSADSIVCRNAPTGTPSSPDICVDLGVGERLDTDTCTAVPIT